jgi:hypothetical protein
MAKPLNIINVELGSIGNTCFVVMPFAPLFETEYERVIKTAVEASGLECIRADDLYTKPRIVDDIWRAIRSAHVVLAELTGRNPNVLYEVGLAHAVGKPVIIITRSEDDVPFDLKALRYLYYDTNDPLWGQNLGKAIEAMLKNVLTEADLSKHLEGISPVGEIAYEASPEAPSKPKEPALTIPDISGFWMGSFISQKELVFDCMMSLQQDGQQLSATMTITYPWGGKISIIQETFSGLVSGSTVNLTGVNYSYIERGKPRTTP